MSNLSGVKEAAMEMGNQLVQENPNPSVMETVVAQSNVKRKVEKMKPREVYDRSTK